MKRIPWLQPAICGLIMCAYICALVCMSYSSALGQEWKPVTDLKSIFSEGRVQVIGISTTQGLGKTKALRTAQLSAHHELVEAIKALSLYGNTTVKEGITSSDEIRIKVENVLHGAVNCGERYNSDKELAEVCMSVNLYGAGGLYSLFSPLMKGNALGLEAKPTFDASLEVPAPVVPSAGDIVEDAQLAAEPAAKIHEPSEPPSEGDAISGADSKEMAQAAGATAEAHSPGGVEVIPSTDSAPVAEPAQAQTEVSRPAGMGSGGRSGPSADSAPVAEPAQAQTEVSRPSGMGSGGGARSGTGTVLPSAPAAELPAVAAVDTASSLTTTIETVPTVPKCTEDSTTEHAPATRGQSPEDTPPPAAAPAEPPPIPDGLIVDVRECQFMPAMVNRILTDKEHIVVDPSTISKRFLIERGCGGFATELDKAKALLSSWGSDNPLIVKCAGVASSTDAIISSEDAATVVAHDKKSSFLSKARIVFLFK